MTAGEVAERSARWERARTEHEDAVRRAGMIPGRARRRLRYAGLTPAGPLVLLLAVLVVGGYAGWLGWRGGAEWATAGRLAVFVLLLVLAATNRAGVTPHGLSFDVAGFRRLASFGFVPLHAVRDTAVGRRPAGWPRAGLWHGEPFPGLHRVHVRFTDRSGADRVRTAWVRRPERYAETVLGGRDERRRTGGPRPRRGRPRRR